MPIFKKGPGRIKPNGHPPVSGLIQGSFNPLNAGNMNTCTRTACILCSASFLFGACKKYDPVEPAIQVNCTFMNYGADSTGYTYPAYQTLKLHKKDGSFDELRSVS